MYSRYIGIAIFVALLVLITFYDKSPKGRKFKYYGLTFIEGMIGGFIIDCIGINAGYYVFPRQPFLSMEYWAIVIPCWGVFGLFINCLWKWAGKEKFLQGMAVTILPLFALYEGTNLITGSWVYNTPFWAVGLGWIPLIWVFSGCNRRRRVVHKIELLAKGIYGNSPLEKVARCSLVALRFTLIVVMFPLLLVNIVRILAPVPQMIKDKTDVKSYLKVMILPSSLMSME